MNPEKSNHRVKLHAQLNVMEREAKPEIYLRKNLSWMWNRHLLFGIYNEWDLELRRSMDTRLSAGIAKDNITGFFEASILNGKRFTGYTAGATLALSPYIKFYSLVNNFFESPTLLSAYGVDYMHSPSNLVKLAWFPGRKVISKLNYSVNSSLSLSFTWEVARP